MTMAATLPTSSAAEPRHAGRSFRTPLLALAITVILMTMRALGDWTRLSIFLLPDSDDMMRLAEVRDWVGGQGFHDLMQHRLGIPPGASMHWSRIADAGPAAIIVLLTRLVGDRAATLAMLVGYQAALFFAYLLLAARNARLLIGPRAEPVAVALAALAFPTLSLFQPGRIDHHGLQIVLTMVVVGSLVARPSWREGLAGGVAAALSLAVGLEVAPELIAAFAALGLQWALGGRRETARLGGFGAGLGCVTLALYLWARPTIWPTEWCDGFTPASTSATFAAALALSGLAIAGVRWISSGPRLGLATATGVLAGGWVLHAAPVCLRGPYGALDPFLKMAFMSNVSEAKDLFLGQDTWGTSLAYGGLCLASLVALWLVLRSPERRSRWWPFAIFLALSVIVAVLQIRVTYILAGIATLPFVALMTDTPGGPATLGRRLALWLAGSGIVYNMAGVQLDRLISPPPLRAAKRAAKQCLDPGPLLTLAAMPSGTVMAPLDSAAYVIGMTAHRSLAAPYHRNNAGNLAMYRFFLAPDARAAAIARRLRVTYVLTCPNSLAEDGLEAFRPGSLIDALQAGRSPAWLTPVIREPGGMAIYRVR